jgi:hypothetical protein
MTRITSYATLISAIVDELKDSSLEAAIPGFIQSAEAQFDRRLFASNSEATATSTLSVGTATVALPTDFKAARLVYINGDPSIVLDQMPLNELRRTYLDWDNSQPRHYAILGNSLILGPAPDSAYTLSLDYVQGFTALTASNTTNWLLEKHPDLYRYGVLRHAELYGWNDERGRQFDAFVDNILTEIQQADIKRRYSGPMRMRAGTGY